MKPEHIISTKLVINRNIAWLFDFTQNFDERKKWDTQTSEISFLEGHEELKPGARVFTRSVEGIRMDTEYLVFSPPQQISIKMINKSSVFKSFVGTWDYIENDHQNTTIRITYQFGLKFPYSFVSPLVRRKIKQNMSKKLYLLEEYLAKSRS